MPFPPNIFQESLDLFLKFSVLHSSNLKGVFLNNSHIFHCTHYNTKQVSYVNEVNIVTNHFHCICCWPIYKSYSTSTTQRIRICWMQLFILVDITHKSLPFLCCSIKEPFKGRFALMWKKIVLYQGLMWIQVGHCSSMSN